MGMGSTKKEPPKLGGSLAWKVWDSLGDAKALIDQERIASA